LLLKLFPLGDGEAHLFGAFAQRYIVVAVVVVTIVTIVVESNPLLLITLVLGFGLLP
jgi:hypothetical protein